MFALLNCNTRYGRDLYTSRNFNEICPKKALQADRRLISHYPLSLAEASICYFLLYNIQDILEKVK